MEQWTSHSFVMPIQETVQWFVAQDKQAMKRLQTVLTVSADAKSRELREAVMDGLIFIEPKRALALREQDLSARKRVEMRKRILVVDDDRALLWLIRELLEDEAYEVNTAIDGADALDHLSHQHRGYDVVLLDVTMPRLNGLQFLHKVQEQDSPPLGSIIALSVDEEALQQAACLGIGTTLKKPFDLEALLALVG